MKKLILSLITILSCITYYILPVISVQAQQVTLSLSPPIVELLIKPGKSVVIAYNLQNISDPSTLKAKVRPFTPQGILGQQLIRNDFEGPIRFSLDNSHLALEQPFFLKTKDNQQLILRIRVPDGAPEGDYYYSLLVESQPVPALGGVTSSQAKTTIGSTILITVTSSGKVDIRGKIAFFDIQPRYKLNLLGRSYKIVDSNDQIPVTLIVQNLGKNLIKPQGELVLSGPFYDKNSYMILPQNILAESQRLVRTFSSIDLNSNKPTSLVLSGFFLGRYRLTTTINFGTGTTVLLASTSFIALPIKFIIVFLITVTIGVFIILKLKTNVVS